jgi:hypothetical protein
MKPMGAFFVLQSGGWAEREACLCRPFLGSRGGHGGQMPWVAVARGLTNGRYDLVRREGLAAGDARALIDEAQAHADASQRTWQVSETRGLLFFKKPSLIRAIVHQPPGATPDPMDDLSSEQILSPKALAEASAQLGSTALIAVIPKRGWLMITTGRPGEFPQMMKAHQVADGVFGLAEADAITPYAFFIQDGAPSGVSMFDRGSGSLSLMKPVEKEWLL